MKILITGVAGLLGSRLADWLAMNTNHDIIGIDDLSGGYVENINPKVQFFKLNLIDLKTIKKIFEDNKPDIVYHFAAYAAEGLSPFIRKYNYENNLISSTNLITACIEYNVDRVIFTSSMSVYGNKYKPPFDEELSPYPIDPYAVAKYAVEQDLRIAFEHHGLKYTIIRPHNFYGEKQNIWDKYRNVLGIWMFQLLEGNQPTIFGDGLQMRAFSYVDDSILPFWNASQNDDCIGQIINLGGIKEYSILNACEILLKVAKTDLKPIFLEQRHETKYAWATWDKSVKLLDFKHEIDLEDGLSRMWKWAQNQPRRNRFIWSEYELNKGLYDYWKN
jgi:UDP-glucose 4-epimerase